MSAEAHSEDHPMLPIYAILAIHIDLNHVAFMFSICY
jgi:hypothetical protein